MPLYRSILYEKSNSTSLVFDLLDHLPFICRDSLSDDHCIKDTWFLTKHLDSYWSGIYCPSRIFRHPHHYQYCELYLSWGQICLLDGTSGDTQISSNNPIYHPPPYLDRLRIYHPRGNRDQYGWTPRWCRNLMSDIRPREQGHHSESPLKSLYHHE